MTEDLRGSIIIEEKGSTNTKETRKDLVYVQVSGHDNKSGVASYCMLEFMRLSCGGGWHRGNNKKWPIKVS
jgi:hypothetical protein